MVVHREDSLGPQSSVWLMISIYPLKGPSIPEYFVDTHSFLLGSSPVLSIPASCAWRPSPLTAKALGTTAVMAVHVWWLIHLRLGTASIPVQTIVVADTTSIQQDAPNATLPDLVLTTISNTSQGASHPTYVFATILPGEGDTKTNIQDVYFRATRFLLSSSTSSPTTLIRSHASTSHSPCKKVKA